MTALATAEPTSRPSGLLVGGLAAEIHTLRAGDHLAQEVVRRLRAAGVAGVEVTTHWVGDIDRQLGLSVVSATGAPLWSLLVHTLAEAHSVWAVAVDARCAGSVALFPAARAAAAERRGRQAGRVVVLPGDDTLPAHLTVQDLLVRTSVQRVQLLGSTDPAPSGAVIETRNHLRPQWSAGELVLTVQPARGGVLVPFESPNPTPCCAEHA